MFEKYLDEKPDFKTQIWYNSILRPRMRFSVKSQNACTVVPGKGLQRSALFSVFRKKKTIIASSAVKFSLRLHSTAQYITILMWIQREIPSNPHEAVDCIIWSIENTWWCFRKSLLCLGRDKSHFCRNYNARQWFTETHRIFLTNREK